MNIITACIVIFIILKLLLKIMIKMWLNDAYTRNRSIANE